MIKKRQLFKEKLRQLKVMKYLLTDDYHNLRKLRLTKIKSDEIFIDKLSYNMR